MASSVLQHGLLISTWVLQELNFPPEVDHLSEEKRMALASAVEERNCVHAEANLASHRCRQLVFAAHSQALLMGKFNSKAEAISQQIAQSIRDAIGNPAVPPNGAPMCMASFSSSTTLMLIGILSRPQQGNTRPKPAHPSSSGFHG
jgi:hypothetical protein